MSLEFGDSGSQGAAMGFFYRALVRPALFRSDAEDAHDRAVRALRLASTLAPVRAALAWTGRTGVGGGPIQAFGLSFPNRVGVAAGFDKNAVCWPALLALGFGHVEVGTVTQHAQEGNPKPRAFRYPAEHAVINRMGFNNAGAAAMAERFAGGPGPGKRPGPVGINLGKSRVTSIDDALEDYLDSFRRLADHADYVVVNVSSPNTPDLRKLQDEDRLRALLSGVQRENRARGAGARPLLLKIAPDLSFPQIDAVIQAATDIGLAGIIATNTTLARPGTLAAVGQDGGLSGRPLRQRSTDIVRYIVLATDGKLPVIAAGGVDDAVSAGEKLDVGATLVQLYTGMIYEGPYLGREIARALAARDEPLWRL